MMTTANNWESRFTHINIYIYIVTLPLLLIFFSIFFNIVGFSLVV